MRFLRYAVILFVLAFACAEAFAQSTLTPSPSPDDADKRAKLDALVRQSLDDTTAKAASLRLPENRAVVYSMLGDMYWRFDQKHAHELFRDSGAELSAYNADAEKQSTDASPQAGFVDMAFFTIDPRYTVIPLIAKHDAEMAMQIMLQTRRTSIADAMANASQSGEPASIGYFGPGPSGARASQELALEQQIANYLADQDPDAAVRLIKESLSKGISYSVLPLLQKLAKNDEKKAAELGGSVVQKLLDSDLTKSQDLLRTGISFLQYSTRQQQPANPPAKQFSFTDAQQKDIAAKLVVTLMTMPPTTSSNNWFTQVIPLVDKFAPERSLALKQRQAEIQKSMPSDIKRMQQQQNLFGPNVSAEQMIAMLPKLSEMERNSAYGALQNKIGAITDEAQAKKVIDQIPDEKMRASVEQQVNSTRAMRSIEAGKLDDARKQIAQLTDRRQQLQRYVALAIAYNKSGKEADIDTARSLLRDAKGLAASFPDTGDDLTDLMDLVRGYAVVEPDAAFKMVEPAIDMINEYMQASAVLSKYNKDRSFRNGELVFRTNGPASTLALRYASQMQMLGKADLERSNQLIDRFSRADLQVILRLYVLQATTPAPRPSVTQ